MKIDWAALGIVAVVAVAATLVFTVLLSAGIRLVSQATVETNQAQRSGGVRSGGVRGAGGGRTAVAARSTTGLRAAGYGLLGLAGLVVLFGLYLIVPAFH